MLDEENLQWKEIDFMDIKKGMKFMLFNGDTGEQIRRDDTLETCFVARTDVYYNRYLMDYSISVEKEMYDSVLQIMLEHGIRVREIEGNK